MTSALLKVRVSVQANETQYNVKVSFPGDTRSAKQNTPGLSDPGVLGGNSYVVRAGSADRVARTRRP